MVKINSLRNIIILFFLCIVFFMLGNGIINLTNPDEVFYAQTAKEMAQHKSWAVPYLFGQPQFEKPVLTYWLLRIGFIVFGVTNFSARFFPALFALIGVIAVYLLALLGYKEEKKAFISAIVLMSSGLYIGLARTLFTDMIFSVFILLSLGSFFLAYVNRSKKLAGIILFFTFSGLAVLTKGPLGFILPLSAVLIFLAIRKELKFLFCRYSFWGLLIFIVMAIPWYWLMWKKYGSAFINEFFYNDHIRRLTQAEHSANDRWFFYPLSMFLCMFPWTIFLLTSVVYFIKKLKEKGSLAIYHFLFSWIVAIFVIFQVGHSKLVSYIFPMFPALAIITGDFIYSGINSRKRLISIILFIQWLILIFLPLGLLFVATTQYAIYLPPRTIIYDFILWYALLLVVMLIFIARKKTLISVYLLAGQIVFILFFALSAYKYYGDYISTRNASAYLLDNYKGINNRILCSKSLVRGVRFFTDKDVAVINIGGVIFLAPIRLFFWKMMLL